MYKEILRNGAKYSFLPVFSELFGSDKVEKATKTEQTADRSVSESGWERVQRIFRVDEFGNVSHEANSILQTGAMSMFVGAIYGGVALSRVAYTDFMRNNDATSFETHFDAKRKLQHEVTMAFGKGAFRMGWRLALFSTSFVAISTMIQVYRGKYGILEYTSAGAVTGFMYKFNMGPRGWIVGSGLGSVLGLICGATTTGLLSLAGLSVEEARYWQYQWKDNRNEYIRKGIAAHLDQEEFAVIKLHDQIVGEAGKQIENLDNTVKDSKENSVDKNKT